MYSEHKLKDKTRFVRKIWTLDNSTGLNQIEDLKILPNGCFNFAVIIGQGVWVQYKDEHYSLSQGIYLSAQITKYINLSVQEKTKVILVQLNPWYFSYIPHCDFSNFIDTVSRCETDNKLFGESLDLLAPSLLNHIIRITEKYFSTFEKANVHSNVIEDICRHIISTKGNVKTSDVLKSHPYSERWLQLQFKKVTGLTPKQFAKTIQFRNSVDEIAFNKKVNSLTSIGYISGYTDQSHFIKNFNKFSTTTPSKFDPKHYILSYRSDPKSNC